MASGRSGYFDLSGNYGVTLRLHWAETYAVETNQSVVNITGIQVKSSWYYGVTYYLDGTVSVGGTAAFTMSSSAGTNSVTVSSLDTFANAGGSFGSVSGITHNSDGTKSTTVTVSVRGFTQSGGAGSGWTVSGGKTIELTTIPRKSTLTAQNGTLGAAQTLTVSRKSSSFTHSIGYSCGTASGTVCEKSSAESIAWTPPMALAAQNTTGTAVSVNLTITTYNGSAAIGESSAVITCAIPESVAPSCNLAVADDTDLSSTYGAMVRGYSRMAISVTAATAYGSGIASYRISANDAVYNTASVVTEALKHSGTLTVSASVTDQRGRTAQASKTVSVLDYAPPTVTLLKVRRCNSDGTENDRGEFAQVTFSAAVSPLNNKNTPAYALEYKKTADSQYTKVALTAHNGKFSVTEGKHIFAADSGSSYDVKIRITDDLSQGDKSTVVSTGATIFHFKANGKGMGIGKMGELDNGLDMGWQIRMNGNKVTGLASPTASTDGATKAYVDSAMSAARLLNLIYPIGSIYMSVNDVSPQSFLGGTWERLQDRFLLGAGSTYAAGAIGGEASHTLTVNEIPSHVHPLSYRNIYASGDSYTAATVGQPTYGNATTGYTGGGAAHNNMPPYLAVYMWKRTG